MGPSKLETLELPVVTTWMAVGLGNPGARELLWVTCWITVRLANLAEGLGRAARIPTSDQKDNLGYSEPSGAQTAAGYPDR